MGDQPRRGDFATDAEYNNAWKRANRASINKRVKRHRSENLEQYRKLDRERYKRDRIKRMQMVYVRMRHIRGMIRWRYRKEIGAIYEEARRITAETGVLHVVDHIWPLKHPLCCGLHVPWNLQIITGVENDKKGNKLPDHY